MKRVFVVADEAVGATELRDHLRDLGYEVCGHVVSGKDALEQIPVSRPDIVLMDIDLSAGVPGPDVAERLGTLVDVPVILLTVHSDTELTQRASRSQSFAYVVKPFDPRVLGANIELALARHEATVALRASEEQSRTLLAEKDVLLREVHHRVRNNLQVICSLLALQAERVAHAEARFALQDVERRVRVMSMVHERLYRSTTWLDVELSEHVESLSSMMAQSHGTGTGVSLTCAARPVRVALDTAIPLGLILNELLVNAYRHAFRGRAKGGISVHCDREGGEVVLRVEDDGIGLGPTFDVSSAQSLGLSLVTALVRQLSGRVEFRGGVGTTVIVRAPLAEGGSGAG